MKVNLEKAKGVSDVIFDKKRLVKVKGISTTMFDKTTNILTKFSPFGTGIDHEKIKQEAYEWMDEIKSPGAIFTGPYTPADLRKSQTRTIRSKSGMAIAGLTLLPDWTMGADSGIKQIPLALFLFGVIMASGAGGLATGGLAVLLVLFGLGMYKLTGATFGDMFLALALAGAVVGLKLSAGEVGGGLVSTVGLTLPAIAIYFAAYMVKKNRAEELLKQSRHHTATGGDNEGNLRILEAQIAQAIKDDAKAPFLPLIKATGTFQHRGSFESPDAGTVVGLNLSDLSQHIFVMGKPGTGKSYFLRKIIKETNTAYTKINRAIGILLMDGKGELAFECRRVLDLLINPETIKNFCLVDGVDAVKFTSIIQTTNGVKFDGPNAEFARAAMELVYNSSLAHILLRDIHAEEPEAFGAFKWSYMYRYNLMGMLLEADGRAMTIAEILGGHKNAATDPRIKQLIAYIEGECTEERKDFAAKYLKTAQGYMQSVLQSESIIKWADSETSDCDVMECLTGKKIGVSLPPERYGLAGAFTTQLVKAIVRNGVANRTNEWKSDKKQTELLFVQDEFQDLFSETDDLNNIPKDRSRGCYNVIATQTVSAIYSKITNTSTADYLFANFSSFVALKTSDRKAHELMQEQCGTVKTFMVATPRGNSIAFRETAQALAEKAEFDPRHPEAKMFKKFRSNVEFNVSGGRQDNKDSKLGNGRGAVGNLIEGILGPVVKLLGLDGSSHSHSISEYKTNDKQDYQKLYGDELVNMLDQPQHAVFTLKRGGAWVKDIGIVMGVDTDFNDV